MTAFLQRHRFLIQFAILSTLMGTSVGMAKVTTSLYAVALHAPAGLLGLIAAAQTAGVLFMSLPVGQMVDRVGAAPLFLLGTVLAGLIYVVLPLWPSPWFLLACTTAISFCMPLRFVSLNTVFMRQLENVGEARAGWYRGTHMAGMFLVGPTVAASAVALTGYTGCYWIIALLFGLTLCLSPLVLGRYAPRGEGGGGRLSLRGVLGQLGLLRDERVLRRACLIEFGGQGANAFYAFFIVVIALGPLGLDTAAATQLLGVQGGSFILTLFLLGEPLSRLGSQRAQTLALLVGAVAFMLLGWGRALPLLLFAAALLGLALGSLQIVNLTVFSRSGARLGRGTVSGISALAGPTGSCAAALAGGALGDLIGLQAVFHVFAGAFLLLAASLGWQLRKLAAA